MTILSLSSRLGYPNKMAATAASPSSAPWADFRLGSIPDPAATPLPYLLTAFLVAVALFTFGSKSGSNTAITHLNPRKPLEFSDSKAKARFAFNAREFIISWFRANPDKPARVIADWGVVTLLPARFINEIRNHPDLSFSKAIFNAFHAHLPGFEGFREGSRDSNIVQKVIMKDLTKYLNKVTEPLSEETALALEDLYPGSPNNGKVAVTPQYQHTRTHTQQLTRTPDWTPVPLRASLLRLVARISSRVFLGDELCRNEEWLKVTREYTIDAMRAAEELRMWPYPTRFIAHWFLPSCRRARAHTKEARRIITPIIEKRRQQRARGEKIEFDDAIEWFEREANGSHYDPAISQLVMSMAAIHTTTDLVAQVLIDLASHPEMLQPVQDEMISVISQGGWKKTSLYNLKVLDSVIKETQRLKPIGLG